MSEKRVQCFHYDLKSDHLPPRFKYEFLEPDLEKEEYVLRANIKSINEVDEWIREFGYNSKTQWNLSDSHPNGRQKIWREVICHHSSFIKVDKNANKRGVLKNASCRARIRIAIQTLSRRNRNIEFMKANLCAIIRMSKNHTHSLHSAQTLRFLQSKPKFETFAMLSNSQPVIKILKRPPNLVTPEQVNGLKSCNVKPQPVIKSLQQREMEYAEARLRIFGTTETEEKLQSSKNQLNDAPKKIIKPARRDNIIRYPKGPDGTKGFNNRLRENLTNINCIEQDRDQFDLVSNGLLDENH